MIENIGQLFENKELPPILLFFGEEDFLIEEAYKKLLDLICPDESSRYELEIFDIEEMKPSLAIDNIMDSCNNLPFLSKRRTIIIKRFENLFSGRTSAKSNEYVKFQSYMESPQDTTFLVLLSVDDKLKGFANAFKNKAKFDKLVKDAKFPYDSLIEKHEWLEFPKVYESEMPQWVSKRIKETGKKIEPEAVELLVAQTNPSLRELSSEIEKLLIYTDGKEEISIEDVHFVIGSSRVNNIFELQKAIGKRRLPEALKTLGNMLEADRQEMLIMTMLTRYFFALWKLIEESGKTSNQFQLATKAGISPYFVNEYLQALSYYSPSEIENAFSIMCETDEKLKSVSVDSLYLMQDMLIRIMKK
jgi:DNA polymerase-3 subunit delta